MPGSGAPRLPGRESRPAGPALVWRAVLVATALALLAVPAEASCPPARSGDPLEPLSNGLRLRMTAAEVGRAFGEPVQIAWDGRTLRYPDFTVVVDGARRDVRRLVVHRNVCLNAGVGIGSSKAEVQRSLGSTYQAMVGEYRLTLQYQGDRVSELRIDIPPDASR